MEQIVFVDCMNMNGSKNPHLFIAYHGNIYRVTTGDYKLTNELGGGDTYFNYLRNKDYY